MMSYHAQDLFIGEKPLAVSLSSQAGGSEGYRPFSIETGDGDKLTLFCPNKAGTLKANAAAFARLAGMLSQAADALTERPEPVTTPATRASCLEALAEPETSMECHADAPGGGMSDGDT